LNLPIVDFFEHLFSKKSYNLSLFVALIVGGIVLLLLATLLSFALASPDDLFDQDDLSFFEGSALVWFAQHCLVPFLLLGVTIHTLFTIMRPEFLSGHIGEKRPHDSTVHKTSPFRFSISGRLSIGPSFSFLRFESSLGEQLFPSSFEIEQPVLC
jgi:hypothetical protein